MIMIHDSPFFPFYEFCISLACLPLFGSWFPPLFLSIGSSNTRLPSLTYHTRFMSWL